MSRNISSLSGRDGKEVDDALWERLQVAAETGGGTPDTDALSGIADDFLVGEAVTYGTSSFYDFLRRENKGVKAYVCNGSTCLVAGRQDKVRHELSRHFKAEEIGHMCCLGRCHENSAFNLGGRNYSGESIDHLDALVSGGKADANGKHHVGTSMEHRSSRHRCLPLVISTACGNVC